MERGYFPDKVAEFQPVRLIHSHIEMVTLEELLSVAESVIAR